MPAGLDYPLPTGAAYLWLGELAGGGEALFIAFPPSVPEGKGHTVHLPTTSQGLAALAAILRDRNREIKREGAIRSRLGSSSVPTQAMVDALSRFQVKVRPGLNGEAPTEIPTLEALGL